MKLKVFKNSGGEWDWIKLSVPVFCLLVALIYNNLASAVDKKEDKAVINPKIVTINASLIKKAEKENVKSLIQSQQRQTDFLIKQMEMGAIDRKELVKAINQLNTNVKLLEQKIQKE